MGNAGIVHDEFLKGGRVSAVVIAMCLMGVTFPPLWNLEGESEAL